MGRITGELERAWAAGRDREALARAALGTPSPHIVADPDEAGMCVWTWTLEAADATAVVLWTNPVFEHRDVAQAELTRLTDSDLWTISLRLPAALRMSYRIGRWRGTTTPPWRTATGRRPVILAAMRASEADPRAVATVRGSHGEVSSVAAGPGAPPELWGDLTVPVAHPSGVDELMLGDGRRAWVYAPQSATPTPLLVVFDGQVWRDLGLPAILDTLLAAGRLPALHVAMLDSGDQEDRWASLGVPGGQVDVVLDDLLPRVRSGWHVDPGGDSTIVAGQSLGGIAALWTLALSGGEVRHAIAQSPSLWRFCVADALSAEPGWTSIELQAGTYEGDMLADARALAARLEVDPGPGGRTVRCTAFEAGHDWAVWRANLVAALVDVVRRVGAHP